MEIMKRRYAAALGHTHYFTGKPCRHGHTSPRNVNSGFCIQCGRDKAVARRKQGITTVAYFDSAAGTVSSLLSGAKQRAASKGEPFCLTKGWVAERVENGVCEVTGIPFVFERLGNDVKSPWRPSIDRIDSTKGYTHENCQMVVSIYNYAKNEFSDEVVLVMARSLVNRNVLQ